VVGRQERFVVMLPLALKRKLRERAGDEGVTMRALMIRALEGELGVDWAGGSGDGDAVLPGTQRLLGVP
jgi:hypothetical protein